MPIIQIIEKLSHNNFPSKEAFAEEVAEALLQECPVLKDLNTSSLRKIVFTILDYNRMAEGCGNPYRMLQASGCDGIGSSLTLGLGGRKISLTASGEYLLKVCPKCTLTASIGDPVCPNCNHIYHGYETEEKAVTAALAAYTCMEDLAGAETLTDKARITAANKVVVDDAVEGFVVTEGDVDKQMKNVHKYMPTR